MVLGSVERHTGGGENMSRSSSKVSTATEKAGWLQWKTESERFERVYVVRGGWRGGPRSKAEGGV